MKIVIIEDEEIMADDLAETIRKVDPASEIVAILYSVKESASYFRQNKAPDLIFSDIQLGDGLSFEIFKEADITAPVVFCTAYDEYALHAFKANGIDYILKPFATSTIQQALDRYKILKNNFFKNEAGYKELSALFQHKSQPPSDTAVLIYFKEKIFPVRTTDIAIFYIEKELTHLVTFDNKKYCVNQPLEDLEKIAGVNFYRANRKFLINRKAIKDASQFAHRKLLVNLSIPITPCDQITVSKTKVTEFLKWLSGI